MNETIGVVLFLVITIYGLLISTLIIALLTKKKTNKLLLDTQAILKVVDSSGIEQEMEEFERTVPLSDRIEVPEIPEQVEEPVKKQTDKESEKLKAA